MYLYNVFQGKEKYIKIFLYIYISIIHNDFQTASFRYLRVFSKLT